MTLAAASGWSPPRSLFVALAAWPVCHWQVAWLGRMGRRQRRLAWLALLIPFLCPELWAGYAWSVFAVRLADTSLWDWFPFSLVAWPPSAIDSRDAAVDELLLDLLLIFRAIPVGTIAMYFAPPSPLSREAICYCRKLASPETTWQVRSEESMHPHARASDWYGGPAAIDCNLPYMAGSIWQCPRHRWFSWSRFRNSSLHRLSAGGLDRSGCSTPRAGAGFSRNRCELSGSCLSSASASSLAPLMWMILMRRSNGSMPARAQEFKRRRRMQVLRCG